MDWIKADLVFIPEIIDYTNDSSFTRSLIKPETIEFQLRPDFPVDKYFIR